MILYQGSVVPETGAAVCRGLFKRAPATRVYVKVIHVLKVPNLNSSHKLLDSLDKNSQDQNPEIVARRTSSRLQTQVLSEQQCLRSASGLGFRV